MSTVVNRFRLPGVVMIVQDPKPGDFDFSRLRLQGLSSGNRIDVQAEKIRLSKKFPNTNFATVPQIFSVLNGSGPITKNWIDVLRKGSVIIAFGNKIQNVAVSGIFYEAIVYENGRSKVITLSSRSLVQEKYLTPLLSI